MATKHYDKKMQQITVEKAPVPSHSEDEEVAESPRLSHLDNVGTKADHRDMIRMGKRPELNRNFRFFSVLGFTCILMSTWEGQLIASVFGLRNGGLAGVIWTYLGTFIGFLAVIASLAEMASMAPTSGGQYHWVSEFAPASVQKFWSYVTGWVCVLGWQTNVTSVAFIAAQQIQSLMVIFDSSYTFERWQGTLLIIAIGFISIIFNSVLAKRLPMVENIILVLHITGFFAILIPLWAMAPRNSAKTVFTQFSDGGNWGSIGLSCLVGMLGPVFTFIGPDSATHMAEEIRDASYVLPRAMMWTAAINGTLGFAMLVTFCFCLGDIEAILANPDIMPFVQVFFNVTKSEAGTSVLMSIFIILTVCGCISLLTTASRQMFAFARDNGLPFSKFISRVQPGWDIPLNSVIVSFCITILLSLVNIGSTTAFNALASLGTAALLSSYIISITCVRIKRWRKQPFPPTRWSLGKLGAPINDFSIAYLVLVFIFCFFPQAIPITPQTMNWNILIYGFTVLFAIGYYYVKGRHVYDGPIKLVHENM